MGEYKREGKYNKIKLVTNNIIELIIEYIKIRLIKIGEIYKIVRI